MTSSWSGALLLAEAPGDVDRRLELDRPGLVALRALGLDRLGRPVVGDGRREQRDVDVGERQRGVEHRLGGGRRDRLDPVRRRHGEVRCEQHDVGAAPAGLLGQGDAHPARRAVAEEAHRVEWLTGSAGGDEHAPAREASGREQLLRAAGDLGGLGHPAYAPLALRGLSLVRTDELDAARSQRLGIGAGRGVRPHPRVHRRRDEHRPAVSERSLGQQVVGDPLGELRERVRRARGDDEQVTTGQVEIEILVGRPARERLKCLGPHEPLRARRHERHHIVPGLHEQARQLARLVGGDPTAHPEKDPAHGRILPKPARVVGTGSAGAYVSPTVEQVNNRHHVLR